jgi:hypothetical protein
MRGPNLVMGFESDEVYRSMIEKISNVDEKEDDVDVDDDDDENNNNNNNQCLDQS